METNEVETNEVHLFRNIALNFSGGGYRASSFSLGVLSYLNDFQFNGKPLLQNVKGLSTVSGGSLTGATYAAYTADGLLFQKFYDDFYAVLHNDELLSKALERFANNDLWKKTHKKRSLINSFALTYEELLTQKTFGELQAGKSHLQDICFNATDFSFGLAFRFQTTGKFGNYRLYNTFLNDLSADMKLADAIASSSCFPVGFEPLVMPDDFVSDHKAPAYIALKQEEAYEKGIGIMDGGIIDNQGIGSIMKANARRKKEDAYDLIMVCDVGSYMMDPWEPSTMDLGKKSWSMSVIDLYKSVAAKLKKRWWFWVPVGLSAVLFTGAYFLNPGTCLYIAGGATTAIALVAGILQLLMSASESLAMRFWERVMEMVPGFLKGKLKFFENLKLRLFGRMLEERGTSALKMINDVFLKQLRRLNYNLFYSSDSLKHRRITALIYELTDAQYKDGASDEHELDKKDEKIKAPGKWVAASAKIASEMGTTLWFSKQDKELERLKNLVACGQFTACYNLLKYCVDLDKANVVKDNKQLQDTISLLQKDWGSFVEDPYWLYKKMHITDLSSEK